VIYVKIKLGASLAIGFVAAMTALIAGMMTDARMETAAMRAVKCFFLSGIMVLAVSFLLERFVLKFFAKSAEDDDEEEAEESNEPEGGKAGADVPKSAEPNEGGTPEGFVPLGADNLRRVSTQ
jgi:hypothetical protein